MTGLTAPGAGDGSGTLTLGQLGDDPRTAAVVAAARSRGWGVVPAADSAADVPAGRVPWTALLEDATCDAVVVGSDGWNPGRAEAVRTLVQAGRTLVLAQPLDPSMLWAFELDMIARDSGARLLPLLTDRLHPSIADLKSAIEAALAGAGPLGPLESSRLERTMTDRSRDTVLAALARDVDVVRVLVGDPGRVATLGAGDADAAWATLEVGFTGAEQPPVRWQVAAGVAPGLRISLQHATGSVGVFAPDGPGTWTASPPLPTPGPFDRGAVILDRLAAALVARPAAPAAVPPATWPDAARALEIAETVPRSLARGRAIDLHREEFSELATFRGTMASLGCGIVFLALVLVVLATLVAGVSRELDWNAGKAVAGAWPAIVLAALLMFLALQFLPLLLGPDHRQPPDSTA
ncbi:MAG: hypothetical protein ACKOSQ_01735 [Planctomycetaceae bacterium]